MNKSYLYRVMKLLMLFLLAGFMHVTASSNAQTVTLKVKNLSFEKALKVIRQQSGYAISGSSDVIARGKPITISANEMPLEEFLTKILADQSISFEMDDKTIVLLRKDKPNQGSAQLHSVKANPTIQTVITGIITSKSDGRGIAGVTVQIKGTKEMVQTDAIGAFSIDVPGPSSVLIIRYIGFKTQEIAIGNNKHFVIPLEDEITQLQDVTVVNTGYQKLSREKITGSVVTVGAEELEKRNAVNIMQNLEGLVPGLVQTRLRTTIRGLSTFDDSMRGILYVVDGLPIEGDVNQINPYDIESVSVLKDAAAAAIYGARASNGVIVITTKRAKEVGKTVVEVSSNISITEKPDYSYQNWMTPSQQVDYESNYYKWWFNGGGDGGPIVSNPIGDFESRIASTAFITPISYAYYQQKNGTIDQTQVDAILNDLRKNDFLSQYRDNAIQTGLTQQYNFALRTNNGKNQNSLVVNYTTFNNGGNELALINSFTKTLNLYYKGSYNVGNWLDLDYGVNSIIGKIRTHNSEWATDPSNVPAYYKLLNEDGTRPQYYTSRFNGYNAINGEADPALASFKFNHLDELERDFNNNSTLNTRYYLTLNFKPLEGLTISPMFQLEDGRNSSSIYSEAESYTMRILQNAYTTRTGTVGNYDYTNLLPKGGKLATGQYKSTNYTARVQASYVKEFGKHGVIALAGTEFRETLINAGSRGILLGFDDQLQTQSTNQMNFGDLYAMNNGSIWDAYYPIRQYHFNQISDIGLDPRESKHRYGSGYANVTYTYDRKYNLFGSTRKDYADLFGGDEKYRGRPLWSVGAGWIASNESFIKDIDIINYLHVRGSYGLTGNIKNVTAFLAATTGINSVTQLPNASVTNPPNPQLRWEKTATTNIGVDFAIVNNRLRGSVDWYRRLGTDLFANKRLDPSEGFTSMTINNASMVNKGLELSLGYDWFRPMAMDGFAWSSNITGSMNNNKVISVDELTKNPFTLATARSFKIGYPVASIFAFKFAGLNDMGVPQFYNAEGQPTTASLGPNDADALVYMGNEEPKYNLSFNNDFSYKGFHLNVFAIYQGGNYFRAKQVPIGYPGPSYNQTPSYVLDGWSPTNLGTDVPASGQFYQISPNNQYYYADNLVRRADFFKIRNLVLGYELPQKIASKIKASNLNLRFQINNPNIVWYKQKDIRIDAETNGARIPTSFVFGLNANF